MEPNFWLASARPLAGQAPTAKREEWNRSLLRGEPTALAMEQPRFWAKALQLPTRNHASQLFSSVSADFPAEPFIDSAHQNPRREFLGWLPMWSCSRQENFSFAPSGAAQGRAAGSAPRRAWG